MGIRTYTDHEHRKASEAIDSRLTRVGEVYSRIKTEAVELSLLGFTHYVRSAIPGAAYIDLAVTDQGGDSMTFSHVGVPEADYLRLCTQYGIEENGFDSEEIEGVLYAMIRWDHDIFTTMIPDPDYPTTPTPQMPLITEDGVNDYAMSVTDGDLRYQDYWEQTGHKNSGTGRLWIDKVFTALDRRFEDFLAGAVDPMPDPNDKVALARWLARETAPKEDEPLCGCGARHAVHTDEED